MAILLGLTYMAIGQARNSECETSSHDGIRLPVATPPLEPSRPDLFAEPRITDDK
jgi:hypothetical protein